MLTQPLSALVADAHVAPGARVHVDLGEGGETLTLSAKSTQPPPARQRSRPVVLVVDDNPHFVAWLERMLVRAGLVPLTASTAQEAREIAARQRLDLAIVDLLPDDDDGLWLAFELLRLWPVVQVVLMNWNGAVTRRSGLCGRQDFPVLRKPFLAEDIIGTVHARLLHSFAVGGH